MASRIIWGLLLGLLFLFATLQSKPWVLVAFGIVHFMAFMEFLTVVRRSTAVWRLGSALLVSLLWLLLAGYILNGGPQPGRFLALGTLMVIGAMCIVVATTRTPGASNIGGALSTVLAALLITLPLACIPQLILGSNGHWVYLLLIGASWGADTGAIFAGKLFGRTPLSPGISPKKTVEGVVGGALAAGLIWAGAAVLYAEASRLFGGLVGNLWWQLAVVMFTLGMCLAIIGVFGDLTFSLFKRLVGLKDYGVAVPGHGGVLDRFDSMLFLAPPLLLLALVW